MIVIIGFGSYGEAILERAIMIDILDPDQHIACHAFGDAARFLQVHPLLDRFRAIEHLRWLRYYTFYKWSKGNHRDDLLRTHPMMQSFEDLTEVQKESRDYSWELFT